jgi:hypothetical protein
VLDRFRVSYSPGTAGETLRENRDLCYAAVFELISILAGFPSSIESGLYIRPGVDVSFLDFRSSGEVIRSQNGKIR